MVVYGVTVRKCKVFFFFFHFQKGDYENFTKFHFRRTISWAKKMTYGKAILENVSRMGFSEHVLSLFQKHILETPFRKYVSKLLICKPIIFFLFRIA